MEDSIIFPAIDGIPEKANSIFAYLGLTAEKGWSVKLNSRVGEKKIENSRKASLELPSKRVRKA